VIIMSVVVVVVVVVVGGGGVVIIIFFCFCFTVDEFMTLVFTTHALVIIISIMQSYIPLTLANIVNINLCH